MDARIPDMGTDVLAARRLASVAVRFECRHDRIDVAGRERALVLGHDVRLAHVWIDAQNCVAFIFEAAGNAYGGVGSAARGDTAPREKSWERAEQAAGSG
jgi:hypothetical protein